MKQVIFISLVFSVFYLNAQNKFDFNSVKFITKEIQIYQQRQIQTDEYGNKYIAGFFKGNLTIENQTISMNSQSSGFYAKSIFIAKYDINNNFIFLKKIGESDSMAQFSFSCDKRNNFCFAITYANKFYIGGDSVFSKGSYDLILLNYDSNFNLKHVKNIGGVNGESNPYNGLFYDKYGNSYFTGIVNSVWSGNCPNYQVLFGADTLITQNQEIFIIKVDSNGNNIWTKLYGGVGLDGPSSICYSNGYLYLIGQVSAFTNNDIGGLNLTYPSTPYYFNRFFIAKLDSNGNGIWVKKFGTTDINTNIYSATLAVKNNQVCISGFATSNTNTSFSFEGGPTLTGIYQGDYFIACYDTSGNFKWNTVSNSTGDESISQLAIDSNSNLYGVGDYNSAIIFAGDTLHAKGAEDVFVCSYDSIGNFRWAVNGGGTGADIGSGIALDNHGKIYIVGGTTSSNGCYMGNDTLYPPSNQSTLFFASMDSIPILDPVGFKNVISNENVFQVFPNPASTSINIHLNIPSEQAQLSMSNLLAQQVFSTTITHQNTEFDISNIPNGIYFISLKSKEGNSTKKLIIQH